jgi:hypothetical protein
VMLGMSPSWDERKKVKQTWSPQDRSSPYRTNPQRDLRP